jgi:hypothetical protein
MKAGAPFLAPVGPKNLLLSVGAFFLSRPLKGVEYRIMPKEHPLSEHQAAFQNVEDLVLLARGYFSTDFPNPARIGCPPECELEVRIESGRIPDDSLRKHLLGCSECFNLYRIALAAGRQGVKTSPVRSRIRAFFQPRRALVFCSAVLLIVVASGAFFYIRFAGKPTDVSPQSFNLARTPGNPTNTADGSATSSLNERETRTAPSIPRTQDANSASVAGSVRIDLESYSLPRGEGAGKAEHLAEVSARLAKFSITLPDGSPVGIYTVSVVGAYGNTVRAIHSRSRDGKTLIAEFDLRELPEQEYRLCVSRPGESPSCYAFILK